MCSRFSKKREMQQKLTVARHSCATRAPRVDTLASQLFYFTDIDHAEFDLVLLL